LRKRAFPPVTNANTRLLILGSLPGDRSLAAGRYYAHQQNAFWHLTGTVLDEDLAAMPYESRLERLLARGVGLWDIIETAQRPGSLDSAIKNAEVRDLPALAASLLACLTSHGFQRHQVRRNRHEGDGGKRSSTLAFAQLQRSARRDDAPG